MKTIKERLEEFDKKFVYIDTELGEDTPREYKVKEFKEYFRTALTEQLDELEKEFKKEQNNLIKCEWKDCGNIEECERVNHYIENIWNPFFSKVKQLIENMRR